MKLIDNVSKNCFISPSRMEGGASGVITGSPIRAGIPVCEIKGDVFENEKELIESGRYDYTVKMGAKEKFTQYASFHIDLNVVIDCHPVFSENEIGLGAYVNDRFNWTARLHPDFQEKEKNILKQFKNEKSPTTLREVEIYKNWKNEMGWNLDYFPVPSSPRILLLSTRDIQPGEELFIDYGIGHWTPYIEGYKALQQKQAEEMKNQNENVPVLKPEDFKVV